MAKEYDYRNLLEGSIDLEDRSFSDSNERAFLQRRSQHRWIAFGAILLALSFTLNLLQQVHILRMDSEVQRLNSGDDASPYASLKSSILQVPWSQESVYTSSNTSIIDAAWDAINHDSGIVAVPKTWATKKGLPLGSTFPWDNSKAIYFVNAYHGLHCLKNIYRSQMQYRDGVPQSLSHHHITHCLDQLRADVLCSADDTLRVTTSDMRPVTAENQQRTCRDWKGLERWTLQNPGCYRYGDPEVEDAKDSQILRMRYCPEGSTELERVREYLGKGEDWKPAEERVWSWFDD